MTVMAAVLVVRAAPALYLGSALSGVIVIVADVAPPYCPCSARTVTSRAALLLLLLFQSPFGTTIVDGSTVTNPGRLVVSLSVTSCSGAELKPATVNVAPAASPSVSGKTASLSSTIPAVSSSCTRTTTVRLPALLAYTASAVDTE